MIEVVTGEFGNFQKQLVQTADDIRWRIPNGRQSFQRLEIVETLDKDLSNFTTEYSRNSIPTEWARFFVLMARCCIHSHRDWVIKILY